MRERIAWIGVPLVAAVFVLFAALLSAPPRKRDAASAADPRQQPYASSGPAVLSPASATARLAPQPESDGEGSRVPSPQARTNSEEGIAQDVLRSAAFVGQVLDAEHRRPIVSASVSVGAQIGEEKDATSDRYGVFELSHRPRPGEVVVVRAPGYGLGVWFYPALEEELVLGEHGYEFILHLGAEVRGRVSFEDGAIVEEGFVIAYNNNAHNFIRDPPRYDLWSGLHATGGGWLLHSAPTARIQEDGRFLLPDLPAGEPVFLIVFSERAAQAFEEPIVPQQGESHQQDIVVGRAASLRGTVALPGGALNGRVFICAHADRPVGPGHDLSLSLARSGDKILSLAPDGSFSSGPIEGDGETRVIVVWSAGSTSKDEAFETSVWVPAKEAVRIEIDVRTQSPVVDLVGQ